MDIIKAIFTLKSLQLGWAVSWRAFIAIAINAIAVMIVLSVLSMVNDSLGAIVIPVGLIYNAIFSLLAWGWAVQRIKDKL